MLQPYRAASRWIFLPTPPGRRATALNVGLFSVCTISTHALREEGDRLRSGLSTSWRRFLPTPSARRATVPPRASASKMCYFYPRPPRGGRPLLVAVVNTDAPQFLPTPSARRATCTTGCCKFSSLFLPTPSARRATRGGGLHGGGNAFLPTPSARRATQAGRLALVHNDISTHALREEGDPRCRTVPPPGGNFYPRPPRGGRHLDSRKP